MMDRLTRTNSLRKLLFRAAPVVALWGVFVLARAQSGESDKPVGTALRVIPRLARLPAVSTQAAAPSTTAQHSMASPWEPPTASDGAIRISSLPKPTLPVNARNVDRVPGIDRLPPIADAAVDPNPQDQDPVFAAPASSNPSPAGNHSESFWPPEEPPAVARTPWWQEAIGQPIRPGQHNVVVELNGLIMAALANSPRVRAISEQPFIEETAILEASATFDPKSFLESKYVSLSDPVGNTLTTGGPDRFRQQDYQLNAGIRKKTITGGSFEFGQRIGKLHNNSVFLSPPQQGNAKLSLSYTQPMLRGAGQFYNTSMIVLAELDTEIAADQAAAQIQDHLLEVARAYGTLQLHRASLLQKRRLAEQAETILRELEARQEIDAMQSQIARARAALALRRAQLVRSETEILNAETRLRNLIGVTAENPQPHPELVPVAMVTTELMQVSLEDAFVTALRHRPELDEAIKQTRASELRVGIASNEVLSSLDFVLETYVAGLAGDYQTITAFNDQFTQGQPGFTAGFVFDSPWGNRAGQAKLQRRERESVQAMHHFRDTLSTLQADVEIAVREIDTAHREIEGQWQAMQAAATDIQFMEERWRFLPGDDGRRSFLLEDLLRAQERLTAAEYEYALAQYRYTIAIAELKRATGTLLQRAEPNDVPVNVGNFFP